MRKPMNKQLDEDTIDTFLELKKSFVVVMPQTRAAIRELIIETDPEFKRQARREYLKDCMTGLICEAWALMDRYEDYYRRNRVLERLLTGEQLQATVKEIQKLQGETISLRHGDTRKQGISEDMIQRAREYPFKELIEIRRNMAKCPFHQDKNPSFSIKNNFGYCFSCQWKGDTIAFVMQKDGLSFAQAVRQLT